MKVLIITYSYAPDLTPRAFRWSAVARQLVRLGHEVHVLCAAPGSMNGTEDGVTIYRVRDWLINASSRVAPGAVSAGRVAASSLLTWLRARLHRAVRALWRSLYWPDYACGWVIPAARAARSLCARNRYDWIISVSHPFSGHLVGLLARSRTPDSAWFVDIGDPFHLMKEPSPNNHRLYSWISRAIERRVVTRADAIAVTTESTCRLYENNFPLPAGKVRVIPPLLSLPSPPDTSPRPDNGPIRLVFVGTLYRKLRSPQFLLKCFSALMTCLPERTLELHFYGSVNDCADDLAAGLDIVKSHVFVHGMVGRPEVFQAMLDADILVNIGNDSESQLASKVIEYMAVGKPILNLVSIASDTSVDALSGYPSVLTIMRSEADPTPEIVGRLREFVSSPPLVDGSVSDGVRKRYSAATVAGLYASILEARPS